MSQFKTVSGSSQLLTGGSTFYSNQAFNELDMDHQHYAEQPALLSLPNQMLVSSKTPSQIYP